MPSIRFSAAVLAAASAMLPAAASAAPKQLAIVRPALRQYEGGPAVAAGYQFLPGDTLFYTFQIAGYEVSQESAVELRYELEAVDPEGVRLAEPVSRTLSTQVSGEDKDWMPIVRGSVEIPPLALSGTYQIKAVVEDKLSKQVTKAVFPFSVHARQVEPSPTLVERNFRFLRSEEDRDPLADPVYRPGDVLWARFEITGFHYGPNNGMRVEYGIAIAGPAGNMMYSQPQAAVEEGESFYPKRYVPGQLNLSLDKNVKPGEYTLVLTLRDVIGNQTAEFRHVFRIE